MRRGSALLRWLLLNWQMRFRCTENSQAVGGVSVWLNCDFACIIRFLPWLLCYCGDVAASIVATCLYAECLFVCLAGWLAGYLCCRWCDCGWRPWKMSLTCWRFVRDKRRELLQAFCCLSPQHANRSLHVCEAAKEGMEAAVTERYMCMQKYVLLTTV